jgi:hypothetical protein
MFSETTATTPGWKGSAAVLGSVPFATKYSWTLGAGRTVGAAEGEAGAGVGVSDGLGLGVSEGLGLDASEGVAEGASEGASEGVVVVAPAAVTVLIAARPTDPIAAPANTTTKATAARSRMRLRSFEAAEFIFEDLPRWALVLWPGD